MKPTTRLLPLLTSLVLLCGAALAADARKPNILLFYADDMGYHELGCYGNQDVRTPNIDSIAKNGIRFTQGYVSAPLCSPSRAGLMTGRYQTRFGHENNSMAADHCLPLTETTLANRLKSLGYATGIVGKWHLGSTSESLPLTGAAKGRPHQTFYWRIDGMWAVRDGDWKLVHGRANSEPPELFDLAKDFSEQNNLASAQPEKVKAMKALWDAWDAQQAPPRAAKSKASAGAAKDESLKSGKRKAKKRPPASG